MNKILCISIIFLLTVVSLQARTCHGSVSRTIYHNNNDWEHRRLVSPMIRGNGFGYAVPRRTFFYRPSPTIIYNTQPVAIIQNIPAPVTQNPVSPTPSLQSSDKNMYVDSTYTEQPNRSKQIPLSETYKDSPQLISDQFQIYNITKISPFRNTTDTIMIESSSGTFAIPKDLIKSATKIHLTPEIINQLNQLL